MTHNGKNGFFLFYAMQTSALTNMYTFLLVHVWREKLPAIVGCVYLHMSRDVFCRSISKVKKRALCTREPGILGIKQICYLSVLVGPYREKHCPRSWMHEPRPTASIRTLRPWAEFFSIPAGLPAGKHRICILLYCKKILTSEAQLNVDISETCFSCRFKVIPTELE